MTNLDNTTSMIDISTEETSNIDGGLRFSWCAAAFIGGAGAFAGGLTGGAGILLGAELGAMGAAIFCE